MKNYGTESKLEVVQKFLADEGGAIHNYIAPLPNVPKSDARGPTCQTRQQMSREGIRVARSRVERLKVLFSGGQGANRADARIHESLQTHAYQGIQAEFIVVSDDRGVLKNSEKLHAVGMSPVEFWMGFLAGS